MPDPRSSDESFVPRGALAFFVALVGFYAVVWFALYALMAARG